MSVKLIEIRSKVGFEEDPALARFRGFDAALACVQAQDGRRHAQESRRFVQIERLHGLALSMTVHPHVVAMRLCPSLASDVAFQAFRKLPRRIVVVRLKRG